MGRDRITGWNPFEPPDTVGKLRMRCPASVDLVQHAFGDPAARREDPVTLHVNECASCLGRVRAFRHTAAAFRSHAPVGAATTAACLTELELATVAEGLDGKEHARWLFHLSTCDVCRDRLAALLRLLHDDAVTAELKRLEEGSPEPSRRSLRRRHYATAGTLAAAIVGLMLIRPGAVPRPSMIDDVTGPLHRESAFTTTVAPRILGPVGPASVADVLVWTRVPNAAQYRVRVFSPDGTLVWDTHATDTTLAIPPQLRADTVRAYLWKVEARTGWDRWVASEWRDLVVGSQAASR